MFPFYQHKRFKRGGIMIWEKDIKYIHIEKDCVPNRILHY